MQKGLICILLHLRCLYQNDPYTYSFGNHTGPFKKSFILLFFYYGVLHGWFLIFQGGSKQ